MIDAPPTQPEDAPDEGEPPVLRDPYHVPPPPPPGAPRGGLSLPAVASVVAAILLGPVGAILAVFLGAYARREIAHAAPGQRRSGSALAVIGIVLGAILIPAWGFAISFILWTRLHPAVASTETEDPELHSPLPEDPDDDPSPSPAPGGAHAPSSPRSAFVSAPKRTRLAHEGKITVVDLGTETASLPEALAKQRAEATTAGETLLVMTTAGQCDPCRGVDQSLPDPRLQTALAKVRLLRIDIVAFHEDLEAGKIPDARIPGFFLLAPDLAPRDGIDGGEWDADIPVNIAPVLGAFVRGKYPEAERRERWRPVPGSGVSL